MGSPIVKLDGKYLYWSTSLDAPMSFGMTREELEAHVLEWDGKNALKELGRRMVRLDEKGTSAFDAPDAEAVMWPNRAGPGEEQLHAEEIVEFFVRRKERPTPEALAAFRAGLPRCGPTCPEVDNGRGWSSKCGRCHGTDFVREPSPRQSSEPEKGNGT